MSNQIKIKGQFATLRRIYNQLRNRFAFIQKLSNSSFASFLRKIKNNFFAKNTATQVVIKIKPSFNIILAAKHEELLRQSIDSCLNQSYSKFKVTVADLSEKGIKPVYNEKTAYKKSNAQTLSEALNVILSGADGDYVIAISEGDRLSKDALMEVVKAVNSESADVYYSDECKTDGGKEEHVLYSCFSPDLAYSKVFAPRFLAAKKEILLKAGGFAGKNIDIIIYDLVLKLSEKTNNINHIARILCKSVKGKVSESEGLEVLNAHLKRKYSNAGAVETDGVFDTRFRMNKQVKISIIIPTKDHSELLDTCVQSILDKTEYKNYEIIILNNNSEEEKTFEWFKEVQKRDSRIKIIDAAFPFNWSKLNNFGIENAAGDVFIFLNNDTVIISSDWLERLAENALREEIGVVGAQLLYEDGTIQHAGVVIGMGGWADHVYKGEKPDIINTPFVAPKYNRDVMAVTGACMAIARKTIEKIGRFNDTFVICGSDVEICIRAHKNGLYNLYDARVKLYHLESKSRSSFVPEIDFVMSAKHYSPYREQGDPFYNANLDLNASTPKERG